MKTIPMQFAFNRSHNLLRFRLDSPSFSWTPHPLTAIDGWDSKKSEPVNLRLRHPAPDHGRDFWERMNGDFERQCGGTISTFAVMAGFRLDAGTKRTILVETPNFGCFVWEEGKSEDAVLILRKQGLTAHEMLEIFAGFRECREIHGDGLDTPKADVRPGGHPSWQPQETERMP